VLRLFFTPWTSSSFVDDEVEEAFVRQEANRDPHVLLLDSLRAQAAGEVIERQAHALVVVVVVLGKNARTCKRTEQLRGTYEAR
jgi:hypothetical protein